MIRFMKQIMFIILGCLLVGCASKQDYSIKETSIQEEQEAMGRYLEEGTSIDQLIDPDKDAILWKNQTGDMEVMTHNSGQYINYEYKEDGECEESEKWLCELLNEPSYQIGYVRQIINGNEPDTYYVVGEKVNLEKEQYFIAKCNPASFEEIPIEWQSDKQIILKVEVTVDGYLIICDAAEGSTRVFDSNGRHIAQIGEEALSPACLGDEIVCMGANQIQIYSENYALKRTIEGITCNPRSDLIYGDKGESAYIVTANGIYKIKKGTEIIEKVIEGSATSISSSYPTDMLICNDEIYVGIIKYDKAMKSVMHIKKYTYNEKITTVPKQEIVIWTPFAFPILRDAMASYKEQHPEISIKLEVLYNDEEWWNNRCQILSEDLEKLNTQLLAGEGPDIIVLDELPIESYRKNGILADLSQCIEKCKAEDSYLESLLETYKDDDKIYALPLGFSVTYAIGKNEFLDEGYNLSKISSYCQQHDEKAVQAPIDLVSRLQVMAEYKQQELFKEDGKVNREKMKDFLEQIKAMKCNQLEYPMGNLYWKFGHDVSSFLTNELMMVDVEKANSLGELQVAAMVIHEVPDCKISTKVENLDNILMGQIVVGINENSNNKEEAEEIIRIALSTEVQGGREGLPVNLTALEEELLHNNYREINKLRYTVYSYSTDGYLDYDFKIHEFGYLEEMEQFLEICKKGNSIKPLDNDIMEILAKETEGYLEGREQLDETVDKVETMINLYLSEQGKLID